jgi:phytoene desaturase
MPKHVIVIGAGLGAMACASRLGHAGYQVTVLEKNPHTGGKMDHLRAEGFQWDTGPSVLTMPFVLRHHFAELGTELDDYLELVAVEPTCRYFFPDGHSMHTWSNPNTLMIEVARREGDHGRRFKRFWKYAKGIYDLSADAFLFRTPGHTRLLTLKNLSRLQHLPKVMTAQTMAAKISRSFKSPYIRQIFNRFATYNGSSPYKAPATFNVIAYTEFAFGTWYIKGGMYRLAAALERLCREHKVEFKLNTEVEEIMVDSKRRVQGVRLKGGVELQADAVVVNGDVTDAWVNLLKFKGKESVEKRLTKRPLSSSGFMLFLGVDKTYPKLEHHNVFFSKDYRQEFDEIFKKRMPPTDPTIYISVSARSDPTQAPPGKENMFVLVNTPAIQPHFSWKDEREKYADYIIDQLENRALFELSKHLLYRKAVSPLDFADHYYSYRGSIYGHASHSLSSVFKRPKNRSSQVKGLYFAGGSVRPGGGIPLVIVSGKNAAACIKQDLKL